MAKTFPGVWLPSAHPCLSVAKVPAVSESPETMQKTDDGLLGSLFFLISPEGSAQVRWPDNAGTAKAGELLHGAATTSAVCGTEVRFENVKHDVPEPKQNHPAVSRPTGENLNVNLAHRLKSSESGDHGNEPCVRSADELDSSAEELQGALPRHERSRKLSLPSELLSSCIDKEEQRKERNRKAQRKFRERQRCRILRLEQEARSLREKLRQLEIHNCELNRENELMRSYVKYFGGPTFQTSPEKALDWRTSNSAGNVVVT